MLKIMLLVISLVIGVNLCRAADEQVEPKAGTLTGQFIYDGEPPVPKAFVKGGVVIADESLLVDKDSRGIANTVVMIFRKKGEAAPKPIYPAGFAPPTEATLTATTRFEPHVQIVGAGQKLHLVNADPRGLGHNIKVDLLMNPPINTLVPGFSSSQFELVHSEKLPAPVNDSKFPWMRAYLVVTEHPFVAVSDSQGKFQIGHLPPGKWTFRVWQEQAGLIEKVDCKVAPGPWKRGQFTLMIKPGEKRDLGEIKVSPDEWSDP